MPTYQTRHLEAQADFSHGDLHLRKGDRFEASEIDADYYIDKKRAIEVQAKPVPPVAPRTATPMKPAAPKAEPPQQAAAKAKPEAIPAQPAKPVENAPSSLVITAADVGVPLAKPAGA